MLTCSREAYQLVGKYSYILYNEDNLVLRTCLTYIIPFPIIVAVSEESRESWGPRKSQCAVCCMCCVCAHTHTHILWDMRVR